MFTYIGLPLVWLSHITGTDPVRQDTSGPCCGFGNLMKCLQVIIVIELFGRVGDEEICEVLTLAIGFFPLSNVADFNLPCRSAVFGL